MCFIPASDSAETTASSAPSVPAKTVRLAAHSDGRSLIMTPRDRHPVEQTCASGSDESPIPWTAGKTADLPGTARLCCAVEEFILLPRRRENLSGTRT